jgi:hypothetical protein
MSSYGAKGTRTPNNRLQRTVRYAARRTGAMGYVPDLHKIWVGTSDQQLMALSNEFPGFYRYALIIEEASEAERNKASRPYDGMHGWVLRRAQAAGGSTLAFCCRQGRQETGRLFYRNTTNFPHSLES